MFSSVQSSDEKERAVERMVPGSCRSPIARRADGASRQAEIPRPYCWNNRGGLVVGLAVIGPAGLEYTDMRLILALIIIIYLVGVGVVLSPLVRSTWNSEPASALADHIIQALPDALAWPARAVHAFAGS